MEDRLKKHVILVVRLFVGSFFVFSGLTKLNDPMGFGFKLEEYFSMEVLDMPFFEPLSLPIAIGVIALEILLGVMLLCGVWQHLTLWALLGLDVFFIFLTFYSAFFDKVTGCGCFGDAIPLTPWQSFAKDLILLALIGVLFWGRKWIKPFASARKGLWVCVVTVVVVLLWAGGTLLHLPLIDFMPYKIGVNIPQAMAIPEGAPAPRYEITWFYRVEGKVRRFKNEDQPWTIEGAEFVDQKSRMTDPGYVPAITDFSIEDAAGEDLTDYYLSLPEVCLVVAPYLEKTSSRPWKEISRWMDSLDPAIPVILLTATSGENQKRLKEEYDIRMPVYFTDPITLKTVIRSYPGVVRLKSGTIRDKKNWRDL